MLKLPPHAARRVIPVFEFSFVFLIAFLSATQAAPSSVRCQPDFAESHRRLLADNLRAITGWPQVAFDESGELHLSGRPAGGSPAARDLIKTALAGKDVIVLEDASARADVVFCRVVPGVWKNHAANKPPAFVVLIDFADFSHVTGDRAAQAAFNPGWGVLHEIAHVTHDADDAVAGDRLGVCERLINVMRRECGLAERADYFYQLFPQTEDSAFMTKLVRISFVQQASAEHKQRRYWLIWDANRIGGSGPQPIRASAAFR